MLSSLQRRFPRLLVVLAALLAAAVVVAGCGSGSGSSSSSSESGVSTEAGGSESSESAGGTDLATAEAMVKKAEEPWTTWEGPTKPTKPPSGINLALVTCAGTVNGCVYPVEEAAKAAESLGWKTTSYDGKGDPVTQNKVVLQAINSGAEAVLLAGVDPSAIQSSLKTAEERGIPVGDMTQGVAPGEGLAFDVGANYVTGGEVTGSWVVADSGGEAKVLPTNDKEFASTVAIVEAALGVIGECSGCEALETEYFVAGDIGNGLGQRIASKLQSNPEVNYVIGAFDPAVADMVPAIQNAGIAENISLISNVGDPQNLEWIAEGNVQKADLVFDNQYIGYAAVDQMIRALNEEELWKNKGENDPRFEYNENVPYHLITENNIEDPNEPWTASFDTVQKFEQLWGVGG
jgi:ABC-type sugar transport system substrate-binding protein